MTRLLDVIRAALATVALTVALTVVDDRRRLLLLVFLVTGWTLCWLRRDHRIGRLARRVVHYERLWRIACDSRDYALNSCRDLQADLADADAEIAALRARIPGLAIERAVITRHPCIRSNSAR